MKSFRKLFYYGCEVDSWLPEIMLYPYIALPWLQTPIWCRVIGPPSSGKSAHLSLLADYPKTYLVDEFTTKCFVSGYRGGGEDPSKLPQMDNKVLVITDESTIMEQRAEDRNLIQSILRKAYDGTVAKDFGNIKETVKYKARFNVLVASTPIIDRYFLYNQALGERYVNYRLQVPHRKAMAERAMWNQCHSYRRRHTALKAEVHEFLHSIPKTRITDVKVSKAYQECFLDCASFVALVRTRVSRDMTGKHITALPQSEAPSRLVEQMVQVAIADATLHGLTEVGEDSLAKSVYVALCSMPAILSFVLYCLWKQTIDGDATLTIQKTMFQTGLGRLTTAQLFEDLSLHKVLSMSKGYSQGGRLIEYRITKWSLDVMKETKLFQHYVPIGAVHKSRRRKDRWST